MISCSNYDYVEMVCLFKYPVEITLKSDEVIVGNAIDTAKNSYSEECLKLHTDHGNLLVVLDAISKLKVLVENPHIKEVTFT